MLYSARVACTAPSMSDPKPAQRLKLPLASFSVAPIYYQQDTLGEEAADNLPNAHWANPGCLVCLCVCFFRGGVKLYCCGCSVSWKLFASVLGRIEQCIVCICSVISAILVAWLSAGGRHSSGRASPPIASLAIYLVVVPLPTRYRFSLW